jgi:hypothetical protein
MAHKYLKAAVITCFSFLTLYAQKALTLYNQLVQVNDTQVYNSQFIKQ